MITGTGQLLGDRYRLADRIAVGGMGEVWRGTDTVLDRPVAIKILRPDLASDGVFRQRFRAEARTAAMLTHSGIAAVYDYGEALGTSYLVMELVPGEPLSALISREGALGTERSLDFVAKTARALEAAHRHGVVHRDVKPANLIVTPDGRVKVTDFGIARPQDHEPLTATGQVMGTAHYLAPEVARGEPASPLSDVYALGVVMYECLAGWRPFDGANQVAVATAHLQQEPPPLPGTVPSRVREAVSMTMSKDPARRPQGAAALADLLQALARQPRSVLTPGALAQGGRPATGWPAEAPRGSGNGSTPAWAGLVAPSEPAARGHRDELRVERDELQVQPAEPARHAPAPPSRSSRRGAHRPDTSVMPAVDADTLRRPRRRRRMPVRAPLAALIALVLLLLAGTVVAALLRQDDTKGLGAGPSPVPQVSVRSRAAADGNPIAALRVREGDSPAVPAGPASVRPAGPSPSTIQGWQL